MAVPTLTIREYHPESGALLGNITTLNFGKTTAGTHSRVKVIDVAFSGASNIGNIKLGIVSSGGLTIAASGTEHFGIESSATFSSTIAAEPLTEHFPGLNATGLSSDSNNMSVGARSSVLSDYIYLDAEVSSTALSQVNGSYKIFFDYS